VAATGDIRVGIITEPRGPHLSIYLKAFATTRGIERVAIADASSTTFKDAKTALGSRGATLETFTDYRKMLAEFRPQLALVTLAADHAPEPILAALESGCHVVAEKPACVRASDFERAVRLAESKQRNLMLAFANRRLPPALKARELVQSGMLGKLYAANMYTIADQTRLKNPEYHKAWYASKARAGGGHLMWLGIHYLDLIKSPATAPAGLKPLAMSAVADRRRDTTVVALVRRGIAHVLPAPLTATWNQDHGGADGSSSALTTPPAHRWWHSTKPGAPRVQTFRIARPTSVSGAIPVPSHRRKVWNSAATGRECLGALRAVFASLSGGGRTGWPIIFTQSVENAESSRLCLGFFFGLQLT
jgi:predicted dehydrogenase